MKSPRFAPPDALAAFSQLGPPLDGAALRRHPVVDDPIELPPAEQRSRISEVGGRHGSRVVRRPGGAPSVDWHTERVSRSAGRYAPSPSGDLHIGNLRTALLAWLFARSSGRDFALRIEDLDRVREGAEARQLADLAALGIDFDGPIMRQSERLDVYREHVSRLEDAGLVYECFCTRREIQQAASAPHAPPGSYPGTCRDLGSTERARRRGDRPAALRLRAAVGEWTATDQLHGDISGAVDDLVLVRNDGVPAYNLVVVIDDAAQRVDQVVRGDDLVSSAPRQQYVAHLLGLPPVVYAHVPLVVNPGGHRLAKRDGSVTWDEVRAAGLDPWRLMVESLSLEGDSPAAVLDRFDSSQIPTGPWVFRPPA